MLQLRIYGDTDAMARAADGLGALDGTRHVSLVEGSSGTSAVLTADIRPEAADPALSRLEQLGIPADDITLIRLDTIGPAAAAEPIVLVWADVLSQARMRAHAPARYLVLMAVAGVIASLAVLNDSSVLIVGAMATSPDLLPITAACTGLVLLRFRLVRRALMVLVVGLSLTCVFSALTTGLLNAAHLLPSGFHLGEVPAGQTHVNATTILVALAAGVAGMLAVETRASAAVGVAISVTTVPASAYIGVAAGTGNLAKSWSAFAVLGVNIAMMLAGGALALAIQRSTAGRSSRDQRRVG
jgi:uncharacterized hydrophobic protein (TIGR00271 family)